MRLLVFVTLLCATLRASAEDAREQALARMRSEGKPGIVILVPSDEGAAAVLADQLARAYDDGGAPARRVLCEAVVVCVREGTSIDGASSGWNLLLLGPDGKALDGCHAPAADLGARFAPIVEGLLRGKDDARIAERGSAECAAIGADAVRRFNDAVVAIAEGEFDEREAASRVLAELAPQTVAMLALAFARSSDPEAQARIQTALDGVYGAGPDGVPGPRQPYGASWAISEVDKWNIGASVTPPERRRFLLFQER